MFDLVASLLLGAAVLRHRRRRGAACQSFLERKRASCAPLKRAQRPSKALLLPLAERGGGSKEAGTTSKAVSPSAAAALPAEALSLCREAGLVMPLEEDTPDRDLPSAGRSTVATSVEVSARQVFDVQWSFSGKELNALEFKRPAGTGSTGGFFRPTVDQDNDYYRLLFSEHNSAQFQLRQYGANGELKHQLTTYGQIKAISKEAILYNGDAQYGTLITLRKRYNYGNSAKFTGLTVAPSKDFILEVFEACRADRLRGATGDLPVPDVGVPEDVSSLVRIPSEIRRTSIASEEPERTSIRVKFNTKVSTVLLRNLRDLEPARKADFWWTQDDFAEFLKVRVQIGKVYRQAAKQLGVDILKVSSEGSHREEGYEQMVKEFPELAQESRRGLGLGRKKERGRNRDAYIASVLKEQFRQRQQWENSSEAASVCVSSTEDYSEVSEEDLSTECLEEPECLKAEKQSQIGEEAETTPQLDVEASCGGELDSGRSRGDSHCDASEAATTAPATPCDSLRAGLCVPATPFVLDDEALARAAQSISKKDRDYAHFLAQIYYEQDRIEMGYPANRDIQLNIQELENMNSPYSGGSDDIEDIPTSPVSTTGRRRRGSEDLKEISQEDDSDLKDENQEELGNDIGRTANWCKGFGLPRDKLYEAGLSATGHAVTRSRRLYKIGDSLSSDGESDLESGNSDWEA